MAIQSAETSKMRASVSLLATTGLFDCGTTFLALLGIGVQPVGGLRVVCALLFPLLDDFTKDGSMSIGVTATKTHLALTLALDNRDNLV